jgi:ketosteroid isomerase-like protein
MLELVRKGHRPIMGKAFTSTLAFFFTVRQDKIITFHGYEDTALTAAAFRAPDEP